METELFVLSHLLLLRVKRGSSSLSVQMGRGGGGESALPFEPAAPPSGFSSDFYSKNESVAAEAVRRAA